MAKRTDYGPNKYAAYHLILSRWLRHFATPGDYCYVTLGGTELRDVESVAFIDPRLAVDARSYEENSERHGIAERTASELAERDVAVKPRRGNIFEYDRRENLSHIFFVDLEGVCAWADYYERFGKMFQDGVIREGDALFVTSYLGRHPGWNRVFDTFDGQFRILGIADREEKKMWYRRAHPSFTIFKGLEYASCVSELSVRAFGCVEYRDTSPMAVYGYAVAKGMTVFRHFIRDKSFYHFRIKEGFLRSG
jgi:hypothetical protein